MLKEYSFRILVQNIRWQTACHLSNVVHEVILNRQSTTLLERVVSRVEYGSVFSTTFSKRYLHDNPTILQSVQTSYADDHKYYI